jgi:GT2 family glycosyltransferase
MTTETLIPLSASTTVKLTERSKESVSRSTLRRVPVSVVTVAYNSGDALLRCLDSLAGEEAVGEVIVVDNGDGGPEIDAAEGRAGVEVIRPGRNLGFAAGSNLGAEQATGDVLLFLNPDTVVQPGAVDELARSVEEADVGAAMGRLLLLSDPAVLNSAGAAVHIAGLGWSSGHGRPADTVTTPREVTYANGSVLAIRRKVFEQLGGFTDQLFLYHEDLELGWRARMQGFRNVLNPAADVLHDYEHGRNPTKYYFMERNRIIFVTSAYSLRLLLLLTPVLLFAELGLTAVSVRERWFGAKVSGWGWIIRNAGWILRHRRRLQSARTVSDRTLAAYLTPVLDPAMIELPKAVRVVNPILWGYWALVRRLL